MGDVDHSKTRGDTRNEAEKGDPTASQKKTRRPLWPLAALLVAVIAVAYFTSYRNSRNTDGFAAPRMITADDVVNGQLPEFGDQEFLVIFEFPESGLLGTIVSEPMVRIYTHRSTILHEAVGLIVNDPQLIILDSNQPAVWREAFIVDRGHFQSIVAALRDTLGGVYVAEEGRLFNPEESLFALSVQMPTNRWWSGQIHLSNTPRDVVYNYFGWRHHGDPPVLRQHAVLYRLTEENFLAAFYFLSRA